MPANHEEHDLMLPANPASLIARSRSGFAILVVVLIALTGASPALAADGVLWKSQGFGGWQKGSPDGTGSLSNVFTGSGSWWGIDYSPNKLMYGVNISGVDPDGQVLYIGNRDGSGSPTNIPIPSGFGVTGVSYEKASKRFLVLMETYPSFATTKIYSYDGSGGDPQQIYSAALASPTYDIATADNRIYWCGTTGNIYRATLNGTSPVSGVTTLYTGETSCNGIAVEPGTDRLYWANADTGGNMNQGKIRLGSTQGSGTASAADLYTNRMSPSGMAIDTTSSPAVLYWGQGNGVYKGSVAGGSASGLANTLASNTNDVAISPARAPTNVVAPAISGTPSPGSTLTADPGLWDGEPIPTYTYQWQECDSSGNSCTNISGATGQTFEVTDAQGGKTIRIVVTATNGIAPDASAPSSPTSLVPVKEKLTVTKSGTGTGTVSGDGIDCGSTCSIEADPGSTVTLVAKADAGSEFDGWTGACSGELTDCKLTMSEARTVDAKFTKLTTPEKLKVTKLGNGSGTVDGDGILCGTICEVDREKDSKVTLTAKADPGSVFLGWSGSCSGTGSTCRLTMDTSHSVRATFEKGANAFLFTTQRVVTSAALRSRVTVPGPGRIRQSGTRRAGGKRVSACRGASKKVTRAGRYGISCLQTAATRAARAKGAVRVRLCVTYTPTGGTADRKCRNVVLTALKPRFTG